MANSIYSTMDQSLCTKELLNFCNQSNSDRLENFSEELYWNDEMKNEQCWFFEKSQFLDMSDQPLFGGLAQSNQRIGPEFDFLDPQTSPIRDDDATSLDKPENSITSKIVEGYPQFDDEQEYIDSSQKDSEDKQKAPKNDRKKPQKMTYIQSCSQHEFKQLSDLCIAYNTNLQKLPHAFQRFLNDLKNLIGKIYQDTTYVNPDHIPDKLLRLFIRQIYSVILGTQRISRPNYVFLDPRRPDQYTKKAFSKLKTKLYKDFKSQTTKVDAHVRMRNDYDIDEERFNLIFGPKSSNGLSKEAIEFILGFHRREGETDNKLFNTLFSVKNIDDLLTLMQESTTEDIQTNFVNKISILIETPNFSLDHLDKTINTGREFKTPFSFQENMLAVHLLIKKFLKPLKKKQPPPHLSQMIADQTKILVALLKELDYRLRQKGWVLNDVTKAEFKKSEIPSFLIKETKTDSKQ